MSPTLKSNLRYWRWLPFALVIIAVLQLSPVTRTFDWAFYDQGQRHPLKPAPIPNDSVILLVDDDAMAKLGQEPLSIHWPFPHNAFSALLLDLHQAGAKQIIMDFTFVEKSAAEEQQLILGAVAASIPGCILAKPVLGEPVFWDSAFRSANPSFFDSPRTGSVEFRTDYDGVLRHYTMAGSIAAAASPNTPLPKAPFALLRWSGGLSQLKAAGVPVYSVGPYIADGLRLLNVLAEKAADYDTASIVEAMKELPVANELIAAEVRGRVVFIGSNAHGTFDSKPLPVGSKDPKGLNVEPGLLIHWTAWANLQTGSFISEHGWPFKVASGLAAFLLIGLAGRGHKRLLIPTLGALLGSALVLACAYAALSYGHFFPPFTFVSSALAALLCLTASNFLLEQSRKREIQAIFGSYVAPEVVKLLVSDPAAVRLAGERKEASVLFSDLAGFTDLSEKMPAEKLLDVINLYLEQVSECLLKNGAYIDKYIGDAVMAVYGAPLESADHALAACEGALAAQEVMAQLAPRFLKDYGCHVHMRVGVNTGDVIVGNMGSVRKRNYTVLGDPVNLASRLEGANKEFGTAIMIGETTARRAQSHFLTRPLALLRVKGKLEAIEVHELIARKGPAEDPLAGFVGVYNQGFQALLRHDFSLAKDCFTQASQLRPEDKMTTHWLAQAETYSQSPAPTSWSPLIKLDSK